MKLLANLLNEPYERKTGVETLKWDPKRKREGHQAKGAEDHVRTTEALTGLLYAGMAGAMAVLSLLGVAILTLSVDLVEAAAGLFIALWGLGGALFLMIQSGRATLAAFRGRFYIDGHDATTSPSAQPPTDATPAGGGAQ